MNILNLILDYYVKQERAEQITEELRILIKRMEDLRTAATHAGSTNDGPALQAISQQLELITIKHNTLVQEQRDLAAILQSRYYNESRKN